MKSGVYKILNTATDGFYIGSSIDIEHRWYRHKKALENRSHKNVVLQRAYDKYGMDVLQFEVIEYCHLDDLLSREQHHLDTLNPPYNICKIAGRTTGYRHSKATRRKLTELGKMRRHSEETRVKMSLSHIGKKRGPMSEVGKLNVSRGRRSVVHKLSVDDVRSIRVMLARGIKQKEIAQRFNVSDKTISNINTGKKWGWV